MPESAGRGKVVFALSVFCQLLRNWPGNHPGSVVNQLPRQRRNLRIVKKHFALGINHRDVHNNGCDSRDIGWRRDRKTSVALTDSNIQTGRPAVRSLRRPIRLNLC